MHEGNVRRVVIREGPRPWRSSGDVGVVGVLAAPRWPPWAHLAATRTECTIEVSGTVDVPPPPVGSAEEEEIDRGDRPAAETEAAVREANEGT